MGKKGAKLTPESEAYVENLVTSLAPLGDVTSKKMFGGFGIFEGGVMFGLVSGTTLHLKVDDSTRSRYEAAGGKQHKPMPYFSLPPTVEKSRAQLRKWGKEAVEVAHRSKKTSPKKKADRKR